MKLTGFETYGVALGILALRIFRLGTLRGRSHLPSREPVVRLPGSGRWHGVTGALYCKAGVRSVQKTFCPLSGYPTWGWLHLVKMTNPRARDIYTLYVPFALPRRDIHAL